MSKRVQRLTDEEWARIEPLLPRGRKGARRVDDRRVISGIVHMLKSEARRRDCPPEFGPYITVYNRFNRWSRQGLWLQMFEALSGARQLRGPATNTMTPSSREAAFFVSFPLTV